MRSRQNGLFNFGSFLPKFGCHCNSLGSIEILFSIFKIADPQNPTIHAKFVSISCTGMKLCLFECLAYLYHCGYRQFSRFLRKIVENVKKNLIKPIKGTTLCYKKSDAKIQITITTPYLIRIKYPLSGFNYHLSDVNIANFNKIHRTVPEQQLL